MAIIKVIDDEDFFPDLSKDIHYISWTVCSRIAFPVVIVWMEIGPVEPLPLFDRIDRSNETLTLYPKHKITLMPGGSYADEELFRHFRDAVRAQQMIKARNVIFDMRNAPYWDPHTMTYDNTAYFRMLYWQPSRFDFDEDDVNLYILPDPCLKAWLKGIYAHKYASPAEIGYLSKA